MGTLAYWSCPNKHFLLDVYMPQSGDLCNVVGCGHFRSRFEMEVADIIAEAAELTAAVLFPDDEPELTKERWALFFKAVKVEALIIGYIRDYV